MADDDIRVINDFGLTARTRTFKSGARGKTRYTVTIKSEPILIQTDGKALMKRLADETAKIYQDRIRNISATVSPATMKARLSAQKAVIGGEGWAMKRYSGGKTGTRAPARSDKMFNDSGRLLESIRVGATPKGWVVNVAANRLNPETLNGGEAALVKIVERLREFVPEWGDPQALGRHLDFRRAMKETTGQMLAKANERTLELKKQVFGQLWSGVMRLVG